MVESTKLTVRLFIRYLTRLLQTKLHVTGTITKKSNMADIRRTT